jgi:diguanylate cyclase (GGDEF)-like protein
MMKDSLSSTNRLGLNDRLPLAPSPTAKVPLAPGCFDGVRGWMLSIACLVIVALTGLLDYATGPLLSLSIFYLIPVAACAWWGGFSHGILLSLAGAIAWHLVDSYENPGLPAYVGLWNGVVRFGTLVFVSSLVARLHAGVLRERLLARTDPLTGAANGRTFYEAVALETDRAGRSSKPLTLAYLDLDKFKQLNDRLGHAAGDAALVDLVQLIRPALRTMDVLARLGGDEFALLLPETDPEGAVSLLTRIQGMVAHEMAGAGRPVTVSIGAATFVKPLWDVDLMVQQVDALMYAAKRRGQDRVEHVTVNHIPSPTVGDRPRLERRATARTLCHHHPARVRREGESGADQFATVHDLSQQGLALRLGERYPEGTVLVVEPLAHHAKTLLARVVRAARDEGGWVHGCVLSSPLNAEELQCWLTWQARTAQAMG